MKKILYYVIVGLAENTILTPYIYASLFVTCIFFMHILSNIYFDYWVILANKYRKKNMNKTENMSMLAQPGIKCWH